MHTAHVSCARCHGIERLRGEMQPAVAGGCRRVEHPHGVHGRMCCQYGQKKHHDIGGDNVKLQLLLVEGNVNA